MEVLIMPLVKSKSPTAFRKNIKAEVAAGKPVKQAVAIAYAVKRKAKKRVSSGLSRHRHQRSRGSSLWRH
jgi:hypothetical protein